jgi:hypothetical protein
MALRILALGTHLGKYNDGMTMNLVVLISFLIILNQMFGSD